MIGFGIKSIGGQFVLLIMRMLVPKYDKTLHLIVGIYLYLVSALVMWEVLALIVVLIVAVTKELAWDKLMRKGTPEILDVVYTFVGAITVYLLTL